MEFRVIDIVTERDVTDDMAWYLTPNGTLMKRASVDIATTGSSMSMVPLEAVSQSRYAVAPIVY